jgi:CheY-specific phosphatase CheX
MTMAIETKRLMEAVTQRTISFLSQEISLETSSKIMAVENLLYMKLKSLSSLISIGGKFNAYIVFSFDKALIFQIFKTYTKGLDLPLEDEATDIEETAGEMMNIIIGNALTHFVDKGEAIYFSPPIVISEAKRIVQCNNARFFRSSLDTPFGEMSIFIVGPKALFDDTLDCM